jgi:hypothetical protein
MSNIIKKEELFQDYELLSNEKSDNENSEKYLVQSLKEIEESDGNKKNKNEDFLNGIENENESNRNEQSTKDEEDLNELSLSNENDCEKNDKDYVNKEFIDLSFLDKSFSTEINDNINNFEKNINNTSYNNNNNNYYYPSNYNNFCNNILPIQYNNFQYQNLNRQNQIYNMMPFNNFYQNYNIQSFINNNIINNYQNVNNNCFQNNFANNNNIHNNELMNKNKQKKQIDKKYIINLLDIKTNKEKRTTVRMMNIPSYFRPIDLAKKIDEKFGIRPEKENRIYDFIYIPLGNNKRRENINAGYAFINFVSPKHIIKFYSYFNGKKLKLKTSEKVCTITFASRQGTNIKYKELNDSNNNKYMTFNDTKNHAELLVD